MLVWLSICETYAVIRKLYGSWYKLLNLRDSIKPHVKKVIRNGESTNYLYDNWHHHGELTSLLNRRSISSLQIQVTDYVVEFVRRVKWPYRRRFTDEIRTCKEMMPAEVRKRDDVLMWFGSEKHHTSVVWNAIRDKPGKVWWWKLVWYNGNVPKFSFTNWMLCLGKLPTKNRLLGWNLVDNDTCCYCQANETNQHLFFQCHHSASVWRKLVMHLKEYHVPQCWDEEARWIVVYGLGKSFVSKLRRLCVNAAIYHIWRARNQFIF
ncbi:hypothetical protein LIER_03204 [Lithospermum erythrorhizon]|uniref:Reverse transcriptase zinc-binding domain-containing protein n=1 Tax=Lithospermum erythrorhizon TaxID=34254 RepID=A0AAV3NSS1_LITER